MAVFEENIIRLPKPNYDYITDDEAAGKALNEISKHNIIGVDTECTALDPFLAKLSLLQIGIPNKSFVFDIRYDTDNSSLHPEKLFPVLKNNKIKKILQNAAFDMKLIKTKFGFYLENIYDTMLVEQLFNLGLGFKGASLAAIVLKYLNIHMDKEPQNTFSDYDQKFQPYQLEYAANDVIVLRELMDLQMSNIKHHGFEGVSQLEFDFVKPLCEMELNGITMDVDKWRIMTSDIDEEKKVASEIVSSILNANEAQTTLFGVSLVNIDSNLQLKKALSKYGLELNSTDVNELQKHAGMPIIDALLDYRKAQKFISTYGETLLGKIHPITGRLHTEFKQMVSTGRMSSSNPNLQNIPKKQKYRSCFIAKPGYSLLTSDMSGAELRILGNMSEDPIFIQSYANGIDLHTRTASEVFGVPMDKVTVEMRNAAKAINFGLCTTEDTEIITENGIKKIIACEINERASHDIGNDVIIDKAFMGEKEVFELITEYGYSIELTADHLVKIINSKGEYTDVPLSNLDINNDLVCIKKGSLLFPTKEVLFDKFGVCKNTNYKCLNLPDKMDLNWAAFLGLFVSEGSVFKTKGRDAYSTVSFGFSKNNSNFIEKINLLFDRLFGERVSKPKNKYERYVINSVLLAEWLVTILDIRTDNKTNEIRIPDCIKKSPRKYQIEFLRWLFEGDGSVKLNGNSYSITYSSKSYRLIKELQTMLLNFGIISSIRNETRKDYPDEIYYELRIVSNQSRILFFNNIGFVTDYKNDRCALSNLKCNRSSYFVGRHGERISNILFNNCVSDQLKKRFYKKRYNDNIGSIYLKELSLYDNFFKFIYENGIVPLSVKSIKSKGIKKVYDLSIDNHQYFLANGFIIHNCYGLTKIGLSRRLKIPENKAENMINKYFDRYRGIKKYLDKAATDAVKYGFSRTISGRKRFYNVPSWEHPDRKKIVSSIQRQGKNAGIQGANADTIKKAMVVLVDRLEKGGYDAKLLLTVHDEIVVEASNEQRYEVAKVVSKSIVDGFGEYFSLIPMESDTLVGPCWLKNACEAKNAEGKKCGCKEMISVPDEKYGSKIVCKTCGGLI
jgi:DNA polymerase I-like protein with 3'-5' exonuclease and polymerase domains/intein/homing endonuclease